MIHIQVGDKKVKIPESYKEIKVKDFIDIWHILYKFEPIEFEDENGEVDTNLEAVAKRQEHEVTVELLAYLLDISLDDAKRIPFEKAVEVVAVFNNFIHTEKVDELYDRNAMAFVFKGTTYMFPKPNFDGMTFGEYCEIQQIQQTYAKETKNRFDFIAQQIAISCRKKGEEKDSYDIDKRTELFKDLTMDIVLQWSFFLTQRTEIFSRNIHSFTKKEAVTDSITKQNTSLTDMVGSIPYMNLQEKESLQKEQNTMQSNA